MTFNKFNVEYNANCKKKDYLLAETVSVVAFHKFNDFHFRLPNIIKFTYVDQVSKKVLILSQKPDR